MPSCHIQLTTRKPLPPGYPRHFRTVGDHLRKRRLDLGLLQKEVADKLGAEETTIYNWETNRTSPRVRFIPKIIAFLGYAPYDTQSGTLGKRIVTLRRAMGLTQKELARRLIVDASTLGRWEREEGRPSKKLMPRVKAIFAALLPAAARRPNHPRGRIEQ